MSSNGPFPGNNQLLRFALAGLLFIVIAVVCSWLADTISIYYLSRSYVDEIAEAFDFSKHLAKAISILVFLALLLFLKLGKQQGLGRYVGIGGIAVLFVAHSLFLWQGTKNALFDRSGKATKCYVLTRAGEVRYSEHFGVDPATGLDCVPVTRQISERLAAYKSGRRPEFLGDNVAEFFESRTAEAIVWYARASSGEIELFNLMGFHPRTQEELRPVTPQVVAEFLAQREKRWHRSQRTQRPPKRVDPDTVPTFDPATGASLLWYGVGEGGEFEFFDADGFHPATGQPLKQADANIVAAARKAREEQRVKQEQDEARRARQTEEAAERATQEARLAEERARAASVAEQEAAAAEAARREAEARHEKALQAAALCDQLAANPSDVQKTKGAPGVGYNELRQHAGAAAESCATAATEFPGELKYQYQQARALSVDSPDTAREMFLQLANRKYVAAHDNIANLLLRGGDLRGAITWLRAGVKANDPDSMVSMADLIDRGAYAVQNPDVTRYRLLAQAARLGHLGAKQAVQQARAAGRQQAIPNNPIDALIDELSR